MTPIENQPYIIPDLLPSIFLENNYTLDFVLIGSQVIFRSAGPKLRHFSDEIAPIDLK